MMELTITIDIPEEVQQNAKEESKINNTALEDQIIDRLQLNWQTN
jgi:hypothetical protein